MWLVLSPNTVAVFIEAVDLCGELIIDEKSDCIQETQGTKKTKWIGPGLKLYRSTRHTTEVDAQTN